MPTLIQNHRKHVVETRLKHFYSVINQAITLSEVKNGDKSTWTTSEDNQLWNYIEPYLKYNKVEEIENTLDLNRIHKAVYLSNGSVFTISYNEIYLYPEAKKINKSTSLAGREYFRFAFYPDMASIIYQFHKNKGVEPYMAHWDGNIKTLYSGGTYGCNSRKASYATGAYCTAVIQRNGWKIPKDYPFKF